MQRWWWLIGIRFIFSHVSLVVFAERQFANDGLYVLATLNILLSPIPSPGTHRIEFDGNCGIRTEYSSDNGPKKGLVRREKSSGMMRSLNASKSNLNAWRFPLELLSYIARRTAISRT